MPIRIYPGCENATRTQAGKPRAIISKPTVATSPERNLTTTPSPGGKPKRKRKDHDQVRNGDGNRDFGYGATKGNMIRQMKRPISAYKMARQRAIARVTRREIILHCQPLALGK